MTDYERFVAHGTQYLQTHEPTLSTVLPPQPTYADMSNLQDTASRHYYDHSDPAPEIVDAILNGLAHAETTEQHLLAMQEGIDKGLWYWSNRMKAYISPPRKEWVDV